MRRIVDSTARRSLASRAMPLDPAARVLLDQLAAAGMPPIETMTPAAARTAFDALFAAGR